MNKKLLIFLICVIVFLTITSGISLYVAVQNGQKLKIQSLELNATKKAEKAWEKKYNEIQKTPAADLVAKSPRANELISTRDSLLDGVDAGFRARAREILLGRDSVQTRSILGR